MYRYFLLILILGIPFIHTSEAYENIEYSSEEMAYQDLLGLDELSQTGKLYVDSFIYEMSFSQPKIFISAIQAPPNTFKWYMWETYTQSDGFARLTIFQNLTKTPLRKNKK